MSQITLVRHGQANSAANDEASYDRLSTLGHDQAAWLGAHFRDTGEVFARVVCGTLRRHLETAEGIAAESPEPLEQDARLNELEYFTMSHLLEQQHGIPLPDSREGFVRHLPTLFRHWQEDRLEGVPERFSAFEHRVRDVMDDLASRNGRSLVVTSGGLIGMAMRVTLRLDLSALAHICLTIQNTSVSQWLPLGPELVLTGFNATPHLDSAARQFARTHI